MSINGPKGSLFEEAKILDKVSGEVSKHFKTLREAVEINPYRKWVASRERVWTVAILLTAYCCTLGGYLIGITWPVH